MEGLEDNLVETVRARMLEAEASGKLSLSDLCDGLLVVTGHRYARQTLVNFRSGSRATFRLALGIAVTGLVPGVSVPRVPEYLSHRFGWRARRPRARGARP